MAAALGRGRDTSRRFWSGGRAKRGRKAGLTRLSFQTHYLHRVFGVICANIGFPYCTTNQRSVNQQLPLLRARIYLSIIVLHISRIVLVFPFSRLLS